MAGNARELDFANAVMKVAQACGADASEVAVTRALMTKIQVQRGAPDSVTTSDESGFGVRVLVGGRMGFIASNRLDLHEADEIVGTLVNLTELHTPEDANTIPEDLAPDGWDGSLEVYDEAVIATPLPDKVARAIDVERMMLDADPRMKGAAWMGYVDGAEEMTIVNSNGVSGSTRNTLAYAYMWAIAGDDDGVQTGADIVVSRCYADLDTEGLSHRAAHRALRMLGAKPAKSAELPLVVPPEVGGDILGYISRMLNADAVQKGKSLFGGREGEAVASPLVSIVDDGRLPDGIATTFADGEGVPTQRASIIDGGVLKGFLHDSYTAKKGGVASTGNAERGSYRSQPSIGPTNFLLLPGDRTDADLLNGIAEGLYITETQALHAAINPVSGDFSIPSKGLMIRGGELAEPVTNLAVSGNLFDLLRGVDAVGSEMQWTFSGGAIGTPTFRVGSVKVGSEG